ncbi:MAG TPA: AAA family ATPase [Candidatus Xenobia bacterium]
MSEVEKRIEVLVRSRYPVLYVVSWEETRVIDTLEHIARSRNKRLWAWSVTQGLLSGQGGGTEGSRNLLTALDQVAQSREAALYVFRDVHPFLDNPEVVRKLKDVARDIKRTHNTVVVVSPILRIPPELEKDITVVDFPLPSYLELDAILQELIDSVQNNPAVKIDLPPPVREKLIKAALGLTKTEAENVFGKALVLDGRLDADDIELVAGEKEQIIRKSGVLEYYAARDQVGDVGGLDLLKRWLVKRTSAFSEKARQFGLPQPKGLLLLGVQGCGKSLSAKAIAAFWGLPLLRMDMARLYNKYQGESEDNMRRAIMTAESISPCLLWIDELEKGFSGLKGDETGTSSRIFGTFLTWLQEKTKPVFVIATANDISMLPPELLRKGRFDEIFFVDLPSSRERAEIFGILLQKYKRNPTRFDMQTLTEASEGYSGAELEQAIVSALYEAFSIEHPRELETNDVVRGIQDIVPLSQTMAEHIEHLRHWAKTRARRASSDSLNHS